MEELSGTPVTPPRRSELLPSLLVFLVAALCLGLYGNQGMLFHDDAIYFYGGQEAVRGVPPYVGIFEHKAPFGQLSCAVGVWVAHVLGTDDLITTRWLSLFAAAATLALLYRLAVRLFGSRVQGFLTASAMIACWGWGIYAFSGTRPKLVVVLFEVGCLLAAVEKRWFWAGIWGGLAGWTWQPTALFGLAAMAVAGVQAEPGKRLPSAGRVLAGLLVPTIGLVVYYAAHGALQDFLDGAVIFNVRYLDKPFGPRENLLAMYDSVLFTKMGFPIVLGLILMLALYPWRWRAAGGLRGLAKDPFLILLVAYPLPYAWSLIDFQSFPDFFVFLPFALLGFGWMLWMAMDGACERMGLAGARRTSFALLPALMFATFAGYAYHRYPAHGLAQQRAEAKALLAAYGEDARVLEIGRPDLMVLLHKRNLTRYGFIMRGIKDYIAAVEPGGFEGWLHELDQTHPDVIVLDETYGEHLGKYRAAWDAWVATLERRERFGHWQVFEPAARG